MINESHRKGCISAVEQEIVLKKAPRPIHRDAWYDNGTSHWMHVAKEVEWY